METHGRAIPENKNNVPDSCEKEPDASLIQDCGQATKATHGPGGFFYEGGTPPFNSFGI
jgi:hypothetical protein